MTVKKYKCSECGHVEKHDTNHWGEFYSLGHLYACPKCPPYKKYPEFGGSTTWVIAEPIPEGAWIPGKWKKAKLGDIAEVVDG